MPQAELDRFCRHPGHSCLSAIFVTASSHFGVPADDRYQWILQRFLIVMEARYQNRF
jgi:hypothetical protein